MVAESTAGAIRSPQDILGGSIGTAMGAVKGAAAAVVGGAQVIAKEGIQWGSIAPRPTPQTDSIRAM